MQVSRFFCVLFLLMTAGNAVFAQRFPTAAKELLQSAGMVDSKNIYGVSITLEETAVKIDAANRVVFRNHMIYRVDSPDAVQYWGTVGLNWSPWYQKQPSIRARVITPDGAEHVMDPKTLSDAAANDSRPDLFDDEREYSGPLPAVSVGSVVEEELTLEDSQSFFPSGVVRRYWFGRGVPIAKRRLTIEAPASLPLKYEAKFVQNLSVRREETKGIVRITFEQAAVPAVESEDSNLPPDVSPWPYIVISTAKSWQDVAAEYSKIVEKQLSYTDVKSVASKYAGKDRAETIHNLVAYLHNEIRYTGIEFGISSIVPHKIEDILGRKYGDCKDKAAVLVALLRACGMKAHLALLSAGPGLDVDAEFPGMGVFDHAIVYVPGTPDLWIDATDEFRTSGIPYMDQGRMALIVSPESKTLTKTPEARSDDNILIETREFELPDYGPARIREVCEPHGSIEAQYRDQFGGGESKELQEQLEEYVKTEYLADSLSKFEHGKGSDLSVPFRMELQVDKGERGSTDLETAIAAIRFDSFFSRFPRYIRTGDDDEDAGESDGGAPAKMRAADVVFEPFITEWRYKIVTPPDFRVRSLPPARSVDIGPARMTQRFQTEKDGAVMGLIRIDSVRGRYTPAEALEARKAIREIQRAEALMINFEQIGASEIAAGNVQGALLRYRERAAKNPGQTLPRVRLSFALLRAGLGEQSREEARQAIQLDPQSAIAYRNLAWILQHDLIGRRFKKGFDLVGALAAYRKAKELDPKNAEAIANLAILLEHDESGERYGLKAKFNEAIATYREIEKVDKSSAPLYSDNILLNLIYSRQFSEADAILADLPQTQQRLALSIASIAAVEGAEAAVRRSSEIARESGNRKPALKIAADILRNMRMYSASAELAAAALQGDVNAAQELGRVQAFRNTKPYDSLIRPDDPRSAVQRIFVILFGSEGATADSVRELEYILPVAERKRAESLQRQGGLLRATFSRADLPWTIAADFLLSNMQMAVEGNDQLGYRIRVQSLGAETQTAFVARVDGKYKVMGFAKDLAGVGVEVLRQIRAGNLNAAKQWLDWAREEIRHPGGDDPFELPVFPRLWTRGDPADPAKMRRAALSVMADMDFVKPYVPELRNMLAQAPQTEKVPIQVTLVAAYKAAEQWLEMKDLSWQMLKAQPTSTYAFRSVAASSIMTRDWTTWEKAIALRLEKLPNDHVAMSSRAQLLEAGQKFEEARGVLKKLIDSGQASAQDMNEFGWDALLVGRVEAEDIDTVQRASGVTQNMSYAIVHTLACLYAEIGKTKEARELLLHAVSISGLDEPDSSVWYGLGRVAEQYGEKDAAIAAYRRVTKEDDGPDLPISCWVLAQKRIRALATP